jgi:hypothetical protein
MDKCLKFYTIMILMSSAKVEIKLETTKKNVGNYTFPTIFMSVSTFFQSKMPLNLTLLPFTATSVFSVLSVPEGNSLFTLHLITFFPFWMYIPREISYRSNLQIELTVSVIRACTVYILCTLWRNFERARVGGSSVLKISFVHA